MFREMSTVTGGVMKQTESKMIVVDRLSKIKLENNLNLMGLVHSVLLHLFGKNRWCRLEVRRIGLSGVIQFLNPLRRFRIGVTQSDCSTTAEATQKIIVRPEP